jgi:hypothetical protein
MAGYIDKLGDKAGIFAGISSRLAKLSSLGMKYDDMVVRHSKAVGLAEAEFGQEGFGDEKFLYGLALSDIGNKKYIAYFDKDIPSRIEFLNKFAANGEIEFILDTICDESIVYDEKNFFCLPNQANLGDVKNEVYEKIEKSFKKVYAAYRFNNDISAWNLFRKFLITGFLAFEIVYDKDAKNVIGFKEIDAVFLQPNIEKMNDGTFNRTWTLYPESTHNKRELLDSQVIYISYASTNGKGVRISYLERLVRSFNLLRTIENSRVIWNIMNSTFRLKMVIPIGTKSKQKAKESLAELMSLYKEDIALDYDSGELSVNGRASMQFYKNYLLPQKNGEVPDLEVVNGAGPDLTDSDILKYFTGKLQQDSKLPGSRFNADGSDVLQMGATGIGREEIRFGKFIGRLQSIFQEIITKPLWIQMELQNEEIKGDNYLKGQLGLQFNEDNMFARFKNYEIQEKSLNMFNGFKDIMEADGTTPYFNIDFLVNHYELFTVDELAQNAQMKKNAKKEKPDEGAPAGNTGDPLANLSSLTTPPDGDEDQPPKTTKTTTKKPESPDSEPNNT